MKTCSSNVPVSMLRREKELLEKLDKYQTKVPKSKRENQIYQRNILSCQKGLDAITGQILNRMNRGFLQE